MSLPDDVAAELIAAERAVATRRGRTAAAPLLAAARGADVVAAVAVLLPWGSAPAGAVSGVRAPTSLVVAVLIGITLRQVVLFALVDRADRRTDVFVAVLNLAVVAVAGRAASALPTYSAWHVTWAIPVTFVLAFLTAAVLSSRAAGRMRTAHDVDLLVGLPPTDAAGIRRHLAAAVAAEPVPRRRPSVATAGLAALGVTAIGLAGPWERLHGPAVDALSGGGDGYVRLGYELPATLLARWVLVVTAAAICVCAIAPVLRRAQPFLLLGGGSAAAALVLGPGGAHTALAGNSTLSPASGAGLSLAGALGAAALGLVGCLSGRRRASGRILIVGICVAGATVPLAVALPGPADRSALPAFGVPVFPAAGDGRPARIGLSRPRVVFAGSSQVADVTTGRDGSVWFTSGQDDRRTVIERLVAGRSLPVTVVTSPFATAVDLVAVEGSAALVNVSSYAPVDGTDHTYTYVMRLDLRRPSVVVSPFGTAPGATRLIRAHEGFRTSSVGPDPGFEATRVSAAQAADGRIGLIRTAMLQPAQSYAIDPAEAWRASSWPLRHPISAGADLAGTWSIGPGAATFATVSAAPGTAIVRTTSSGIRTIVAGGVSDLRCGLVRDPLSTYLGAVGQSEVESVALDRAGDLWLQLRTVAPGSTDLVVLTRDGVLRSGPARSAAGMRGIRATPDGSLFATMSAPDGRAGPTYRIRDAAAFARSAAPLPAPAAGCISENRVRVPARGTVGYRGRVPYVPNPWIDAAAVTDSAGTVLVARTSESSTALVTERAGRVVRTLATVPGDVRGLVADGRGGAWWFPTYTVGGPTRRPGSDVRHVDAAGQVRVAVRDSSSPTRAARVVASVDARDGSLIWRDGPAPGWRRTAIGGATTPVSYRGSAPPLAAGAIRFAADRNGVIRRMGPGGFGPAVMGATGASGLSVLAATAAGAPLLTRLQQGYPGTAVARVAITAGGDLLVGDGSLARLDGRRFTLVARGTGVATTPISPLSVFGDQVCYLTADGTVVSVVLP